MSNPFGGFVHRSPLSSIPHDPCISLASNCVRDFFGPTVQTVFDAIHKRGGSGTLSQITADLRAQCGRVLNEERQRLVVKGKFKLQRAKGPAAAGYVVDAAPIRASLVVLLQHDIVSVKEQQKTVYKKIALTTTANKQQSNGTTNNNKIKSDGNHDTAMTSPDSVMPAPTTQPTIVKTCTYTVHPHRARLLTRYPQFLEFVRKALDETAVALVEAFAVNGKMGTVDAVLAAVQNETAKSDKYTQRQAIVESFRRLVDNGFLARVDPYPKETEEDENAAAAAASATITIKTLNEDMATTTTTTATTTTTPQLPLEDPAIVTLLCSAPYKSTLPRHAVWRINTIVFHQVLRAHALGRLVSERYKDRVSTCASMVTAALKLRTAKQFSTKADPTEKPEDRSTFTPQELLSYLPKTIQQNLERMPGGLIPNLSKAWVELSHCRNPHVVEEVEEAQGHVAGGRFQIATLQLVEYLRERTIHQMIHDGYGDAAARICSALRINGHMEDQALADAVMIPAKDTRETLHELYKAKYVRLFTLQPGKNHDHKTMLFLWHVNLRAMLQVARDNVCQALVNIRLRRQHEVEVGKEWIERAKDAGETDENDHEGDKTNYNKFCQGLERLDNAAVQLDETLMVLYDF